MSDKKKTDPSSTSDAYDIMAPRWNKISSLLGGTETMRAAGQAYLPQHTEEKQSAYMERLNRATLFNATELTLESWVGRPFSDPILVNEDVPDEIKEGILSDVDLQGNNLDVFCRQWFREGLAKAFSHVLVDFPRPAQPLAGQPRTLADDRKEKLRPYWVHIPPENVIFIHSENVGGTEILRQVRIKEVAVRMDGFIEVYTPRIRVMEPGLVRIYEERKAKNGRIEWVPVEEYTYDLPIIPLVTFYANRETTMLGKPPLSDLADLNIAHWQSQSDQTNILTVTRFPVLALSGGVDDEKKLVVGPNQWLWSPDPQGKFYYVEHTGRAIEAGRQDLLDIEAKMSEYGAEFLKKRPGNSTATARALDSAEASSPLQDVTMRFVDAINAAMDLTAMWLKQETIGTVSMSTDFGPDEIVDADLKALTEARKGRDISRETYLNELKRRGVLDDDFDPEEDEEELAEEAAAFTGQASTDLDPNAPTVTEDDEEENDTEDET